MAAIQLVDTLSLAHRCIALTDRARNTPSYSTALAQAHAAVDEAEKQVRTFETQQKLVAPASRIRTQEYASRVQHMRRRLKAIESQQNAKNEGQPTATNGQYLTYSYQLQAPTELEYSVQEQIERQRFIKQIEAEVQQVSLMFNDLRNMVYHQQWLIDGLEDNVVNTEQNAKRGMEELLQAERHQRSHRRRMCCLMILMSFAFLLLLLVLISVVEGRSNVREEWDD